MSLRRLLARSVFAGAALTLVSCSSSNVPEAPPAPTQELPATPLPPPTPSIYDGVAADPSTPGPHAVTSQDYSFDRITVKDEVSGVTYEADVHGIAWYPSAPSGRLPVLVWLHGRHQTCQTTVGGLPLLATTDDDCPDVIPLIESTPSYRGYDTAAEMLATQGYAVFSIDLNDVNDRDNSPPTDRGALARAQLALAHLDALRVIDAGGGSGFDALRDHLDFSRVGLMGHSRGGLGILKTAQENAKRPAAERYGIRGMLGLAPDTSGLNIGAAAYEIEPDVAWASVHGYCDGDAADFFGAYYFDRNRQRPDLTAPRHQIIPMGANHNNYNTEWAGTDDWTGASDSHCGSASSQRDDTAAQQAQLKFFLGSFFRWYVGGEETYADYWHGRTAVAALLCAESDAGCQARFHHTHWGLPGQRLPIAAFTQDSNPAANALGGPVTTENLTVSLCTPSDGGDNPPSGGHGCPADPTFSRIPQLAIAWTGSASYRASFAPQDISTYRLLSLRVGLNGADGANPAAGQDFEFVLDDATGHSVAVAAAAWSDALFVPPGDPYADSGSNRTLLHGVFVPLAAFAGVDLSAVTAVELRFNRTASGAIQIADLQFERELP